MVLAVLMDYWGYQQSSNVNVVCMQGKDSFAIFTAPYCSLGHSHSAQDYSWHCAQYSWVWESYDVTGIKPWLGICKASTLPFILPSQLLHLFFLSLFFVFGCVWVTSVFLMGCSGVTSWPFLRWERLNLSSTPKFTPPQLFFQPSFTLGRIWGLLFWKKLRKFPAHMLYFSWILRYIYEAYVLKPYLTHRHYMMAIALVSSVDKIPFIKVILGHRFISPWGTSVVHLGVCRVKLTGF